MATSKRRKAEGVTITGIAVKGFKSLSKKRRVDIANLTVFAGANSSGKSSLIQPLLLLRQTLEASYDPGALIMDGPNVKFTNSRQIFSRPTGKKKNPEFSVWIEFDNDSSIEGVYQKSKD